MKIIKYSNLSPSQKETIINHCQYNPFLRHYSFLLIDGVVKIIKDRYVSAMLNSYMKGEISLSIIEVHHTDFYNGKGVTTA